MLQDVNPGMLRLHVMHKTRRARPGGALSDVFISYTRDDRVHADRLKSRLEALGLVVFLDVDGGVEAGSSFPQRIADEIAATKSVVAIWTPNALTRDWCRRECFLARQLGKLTPVAVAALAPSDLREFVDASYESLEDFKDQEKHFGWSQVLGSIARAMDRWAEANPGHADAMGALERAARVRRASIECRPAAQAAPTSGLTGAAAIWARTKESEDLDELQRFAEAFIGTAEGHEARTRIAQLHDIGRVRREVGREKVTAIEAFERKWRQTTWRDELAALRLQAAEEEKGLQEYQEQKRLRLESERVQRLARVQSEREASAAFTARYQREARQEVLRSNLGCLALVVVAMLILWLFVSRLISELGSLFG